jgi:outer membrane receptor protein involved in Fe transport
VYNSQNTSLGLLAKYRRDYMPWRTRLIAGVDLEHSPGSHDEQRITPTQSGGYYTAYTVGPTIYDYDVTYQGMSPYVQGEVSPTAAMRVTAGVRYDVIRYQYTTHLAPLDTGKWQRPADTTVDYHHTSPKLGATYALNPRHNVFLNYSHGFRAPSESQLFRQGSAVDTVGLQPVKADNLEFGLRAQPTAGVHYEMSLYYLRKRDDILSYKDPATGLTQAVNAGQTLHRGVELGAGLPLAARWRLDVAASYAKHTYEEWVVSGVTDYSGNEMETAPRTLANTRLAYGPAWLRGGEASLEWVVLGRYWMDAANTHQYDGHELLNLRANFPVTPAWECWARITNLADRRYAESTSYTTSGGEAYAPGMPRTVYLGVAYHWKGAHAAAPVAP